MEDKPIPPSPRNLSQISTRDKGNKLETKVSNSLGINKTTNSGAKFKNGDLANRVMVVECKYRDKDTFSINKKDLAKLRKLAMDSGREWLYVQENNLGRFAVVDFEFFTDLYNWVKGGDPDPI